NLEHKNLGRKNLERQNLGHKNLGRKNLGLGGGKENSMLTCRRFRTFVAL
ncbi:4284_t:CDS:1, partial [Gigaspora rosea]